MPLLFFLCYSLVFHLAQCLPLDQDGDDYERGGANLDYLGTSVFRKPNAESGRLLKLWKEDSEVNPEELGNYAEGDIVFPATFSKNGLIAETKRWPNGEVPYEITGQFAKRERDLIKDAIQQYHKLTCIRFRPKERADPDWISITSTNTGCWSSVGRTGGRQEVNLQNPGCFSRIGTTIHELLHALGFQHEQNRWERDSYVKIHFENIDKGKEGNFKKASEDSVTGFGVAYDYGSVMHYSEKAFSKNGHPTISMLQESETKIGQREGFSEGDLKKLRLMYNCPAMNSSEVATSAGTDTSGGQENNSQGILGGLISSLFP